jgi:hypothetical protein
MTDSATGQLQAVEVSIDEARAQIDRSERLHRLERNKDFKVLILEGLLREDAVRQIMLRASPQLMAPGAGAETAKAGIEARMTMIGELNNYFRYIHIEGASAKAALTEHENTHEELLQEQLGEV